MAINAWTGPSRYERGNEMTIYKRIAAALLLILAIFIGVAVSKNNRQLTITYIANDGFLVSSGDKKILIDALFDTSFGEYAVPSAPLVKDMINQTPPFEKVDLFLVTHSHRDHFYAPYVIDFLKHHPETEFVGPKMACDLLREDVKPLQRLHEIDLEIGGSTEKILREIPLKIFRTKHAGDPEGTREENLAYLVDLNRVKLLHTGDGPIEFNRYLYEEFGLDKERIDVVFQSFFDISEITRRFIQEAVKPKYVVAMHIPPKDFESEARKFLSVYPNGMAFEKPLESKVLKIAKMSGS
jgi:L-ascorbate metabolism protein UlaG (beta-lactamase superfamily)